MVSHACNISTRDVTRSLYHEVDQEFKVILGYVDSKPVWAMLDPVSNTKVNHKHNPNQLEIASKCQEL